MADDGLDLDREVAGFSLGAWLLILGAGLAIGLGARYYLNRRDREVDAGPVELTEAIGVGYQTQGANIGMNGGPVPNAADFGSDIETNDQWGRLAIRWLIDQGVPSLRADAAVRKYLSGYQELTFEEGEALEMLLTGFRLPPQPVGTAQIAPKVTAPTTTQPPPSNTPQFTTEGIRWLDDVDEFIGAMRESSRPGGRQITEAELRKAAGMGIRPPVKELTADQNRMYAAWLRARGYI